ncbi:MAG: energy transducer TonB [Parabacteroides sp.]
MKEHLQENEVYFLGNQNQRKSKLSHKRVLWIIIAAVCTIVVLIVGYQKLFTVSEVDQPANGETLDVVKILPQGCRAPLFEGKYEINESFPKWIAKNLKYPKGYETMDARVLVRFVIQKDGTLGQFKILSAPKEKVFEKAVLDMLKHCPRWEPARAADGSAINIEYILPISFKKVGTK